MVSTRFTTASPISANYSYTDIADGTSVQTFYVLLSKSSTGDEYILSSQADYAEDDVISTTDIDADLTKFNTPRDLKGTATLNFYGRMSGGGSTNYTATIYKYDGTTETAISSPITSGSTGIDSQYLLKLPLTDTHFKTNDILRIRLQHTGIDASAYYIEASAPIKLNIPFELII